MALICIILDSRPEYLRDSRTPQSLLSMPLGCGTVLSEIARAVGETGCTDLRILPTFESLPDYERNILKLALPGAKLAGEDAMTSLVYEYEPSDHVLILDPRYWPAGRYELGSIIHNDDARCTLHGVAVASTPEGTQEYVRCDQNGTVTRIFRYYEDVTCSHIAASVYALVPLASSLAGLRFDSLPTLRLALAERAMLSRDIPVRPGIIDLGEEQGLLAINEQYVIGAASHDSPARYTTLQPRTLVGQHCRIHPGARIVPPVVIQDEVIVEEDAVIIGPAVIGAGSTIRHGSLVAQSVLASGSTLSAGAVVRHQAASGACKRESQASDEGVRPTGDPSHSKFQPIRGQMVGLGADMSAMQDTGWTHARKNRRSIYAAAKLVGDTAVSGIALILLAPLFLAAAIAIKLDSAGPVFFGHQREGRLGKVFGCLKFRTMCADAHVKQRELYAANALDGPQFKLDNDPRVTRVGQWLRATNIDELPQLINVFLGQMSIVGPRPSPFRENQICVPWRRARLSVRPGITGLWQICRDQRSEGDFHQWITYDIMYVRNLSLLLDQKIILATVLTLGGMWTVPHTWLVREQSEHTTVRSNSAEAVA